MTKVISLSFKGSAIRAVARPDLWWFLVDVCTVLDIKHAPTVAKRLPDHVKATVVSNNSGPDRLIVNRAGLFRVLKMSRKPIARELFDWVTDEVLPTLDRTGTFVASHSDRELLASVRQLVEPIQEDVAALRHDMQRIVGRKGGEFSEATKRLICEASLANGGKCGNCGKVDVVDPHGNKLPWAEHDHFSGPSDSSPENCWIVDRGCHSKLKKAAYRNTRRSRFEVFQEQLAEFRRDGTQMRWTSPPESLDLRASPEPPSQPIERLPQPPISILDPVPLLEPQQQGHVSTRNMSKTQRERRAAFVDQRQDVLSFDG
jgi:prophage antirepressor-like protein